LKPDSVSIKDQIISMEVVKVTELGRRFWLLEDKQLDEITRNKSAQMQALEMRGT
jgi:hypothetical protein